MATPTVAQKAPIGVDVQSGKTYAWCSCGLSKNQPMCDGSHKGSSFTPVMFTADKVGKVFLCACKQTKNAPMCDGSHTKL